LLIVDVIIDYKICFTFFQALSKSLGLTELDKDTLLSTPVKYRFTGSCLRAAMVLLKDKVSMRDFLLFNLLAP